MVKILARVVLGIGLIHCELVIRPKLVPALAPSLAEICSKWEWVFCKQAVSSCSKKLTSLIKILEECSNAILSSQVWIPVYCCGISILAKVLAHTNRWCRIPFYVWSSHNLLIPNYFTVHITLVGNFSIRLVHKIFYVYKNLVTSFIHMHLPLAHYKAIFHSTASKIHEISWSTEKFDLFLQTLWRGTMAINVVEEFSTTQFELLIFFEVRNEHLSGPHVLPCKLVRFGGESIVSMISNNLPLSLIGRYLGV